MIDIEQHVSNFVEAQFPDFYKEEGPLFLLFTKEYYKWLEQHYVFITLDSTSNFNKGDVVTQNDAAGVIESIDGNVAMVKVTSDMFVSGTTYVRSTSGGNTTISSAHSSNPIYFSRQLARLKDLDTTTDNFLVHFKEKYLKNIQFDTFTTKRTLIKAAQDLYSSKGTERSIDLLFKLVFGTSAETYYPGQDVLKPSSGRWTRIIYVEVTKSPVTKTLVGKQINGTISGATAFCEYVITRNVKGKIFDQLILSNIVGTFVTGDLIVDSTGVVASAPKVIGSLTNVDITSGGAGFEIGEEVRLTSNRGVEAAAIVSAIQTETGLVSFELLDGGWGFSSTANIKVSEKVVTVANVTNSNSSITGYSRFETVQQSLVSMVANNTTGQLVVGEYVTNPDGAVALAVDVDQASSSNVANVVLNYVTGDITSNNIIRSANQQWLAIVSNTSTPANLFFTGELVKQSNGSANVTQGVVTSISNGVIFSVNTTSISSNGIHVGQYVKQQTTNATGVVIATPWQSYTNYSSLPYVVLGNTSGTFSNTNQLRFYPSSTNTTQISVATPLTSSNGQVLKVSNVGGQRWYPGNTIYGSLSGEVNSPIVVADVGFVTQATNTVTATANIISSNSTSLGLYDVENVFYNTTGNILVGQTSNTTGEITFISTGQGANAEINELTDVETVLICTDFLGSNNDGYLSNSVQYTSMLTSGANSTYGYLTGVYVANVGSGYDNTNIVTFTGGNTGSGSFEAANASIVTNAGGEIQRVLLSSNTGNGYISTPTLAIVNSTGGSIGVGTGADVIPLFPLGFPKLPQGDLNTPLLDILTFETKAIGSISSLYKINPGENYNVNPLTIIYEPSVAEFDKRDIMLHISNTSGSSFLVNEEVSQTINSVATKVYANLVSGNTATVGEAVYSTDGIERVASGWVYSQTSNATSNTYQVVIADVTGSFTNTIGSALLAVDTVNDFNVGDLVVQNTANGTVLNTNTTHIVVTGVSGTFAANATSLTSDSGGSATISSANNNYKSYRVYGDISGSIYNVANTQADVSSRRARGVVKSANSTVVNIKRTSLFTTFVPSLTDKLIGSYQSSNADIISVMQDANSRPVGDNANVSTTVVYNEGSISDLTLISSGYGYVHDEGITIESLDGERVATGKSSVEQQGEARGFYRTRDGFLSDIKKLHDGEYYQEYSYEVQSPIPLDKYNIMLKDVLHVAGTKYFGRVKTSSTVNNQITVSQSTITIT
jgi:hypothetical protein